MEPKSNTTEDFQRSILNKKDLEIKKLENMIADINYEHYLKETRWHNNKIILVGIIAFLIIVLSAALGSNYDRIGEVETLKNKIEHAKQQ